jgi:UDP-glucose 4-epimerase
MKIKRALVTGGAGFIGSHIVDALLKKGWQVGVIDDLSTGHMANLAHVKDRIAFYQGDIQDQELLKTSAKGCDVIFHQAAVVSVSKSIEAPVASALINDIGTLCVLETARKRGIKKVILASSCAVYGDDPTLPKNEDMPLKPQSPYAVQKLTGELYARLYNRLYGMEIVCLRYFNVFGPRQDSSSPYSGVISIFIAKALSKKTPVIYGDGNQYRDFVFVKDIVSANLLAAESDHKRLCIYNVGTGNTVSVNQLWEKICRVTGVEIQPTYAPKRPGDILESVADIEKATANLGFKPAYSFEGGLEKTFNWCQADQFKS